MVFSYLQSFNVAIQIKLFVYSIKEHYCINNKANIEEVKMK